MTTAPTIAGRLMNMCSKGPSHVRLKGGNMTTEAEVYPGELCKQIVGGLKHQMRDDGRCINSVAVCVVDEDQDDQCYEVGNIGMTRVDRGWTQDSSRGLVRNIRSSSYSMGYMSRCP